MNVKSAINSLLDQLASVIEARDDRQYAFPPVSLSGSFIGQHLMRTLGFFDCLFSRMETGLVNYGLRTRNGEYESETTVSRMLPTKQSVSAFESNPNVTLEFSYRHPMKDAIHHMALIKVGIRDVNPEFVLPKRFGVASSAIGYMEEQIRKLNF